MNKPVIGPLPGTQPVPLYVDQLYARYFQKSRSFLYPLLGISRHVPHNPTQVYSFWPAQPGNLPTSPSSLFVNYSGETGESHPGWKAFLRERLLTNPYFTAMHRLEDESLLLVFDLGVHKEDFEKFYTGKYSQLSLTTKSAIREYYGLGTAEWAYMETYIEPDNFFAHYADLIEDVTEAELRAVGELCDPPNIIKETLTVLSR